jgi:hypothetical protein
MVQEHIGVGLRMGEAAVVIRDQIPCLRCATVTGTVRQICSLRPDQD